MLPNTGEKERVELRVQSWDDKTKTGVVHDRHGCSYPGMEKDLGPDCRGRLFPGEGMSGFVIDYNNVADIEVESSSSKERSTFETVGPAPEIDAWEPKCGEPWRGGSPGRMLGTPTYSKPKEN